MDIVYSELQLANSLLYEGILRLVDFGIANALPDDTVNIYHNYQVGTPNHMAPDAQGFEF